MKSESKRELSRFLKLKYPVELAEQEGGWYFARIPDLPGCMSEGKTPDEAVKNIEAARALWLEDALDSGVARRGKQDARIRDRLREGEILCIEPDPIGVDERPDSAQGFRQALGIVKTQRKGIHPALEWILPARRIGQRAHTGALLQETPYDVLARIPERAGHGILRHT